MKLITKLIKPVAAATAIASLSTMALADDHMASDMTIVSWGWRISR